MIISERETLFKAFSPKENTKIKQIFINVQKLEEDFYKLLSEDLKEQFTNYLILLNTATLLKEVEFENFVLSNYNLIKKNKK